MSYIHVLSSIQRDSNGCEAKLCDRLLQMKQKKGKGFEQLTIGWKPFRSSADPSLPEEPEIDTEISRQVRTWIETLHTVDMNLDIKIT